MRRVVSLWLPRWSTDRLHRRRREEAARGAGPRAPARARPLVTLLVTGGRVMVAAVDAAAAACGILPGMALADARALQPDLEVRPADPAGDQAALARLADWCMRYTPWVALDGADGLWLDVTGCAHLFGGEPALLADLANRFERFGYELRLGLADTPGAASALARFSGRAAVAIPAGGQRAALAALPVAALRLAPAVATELDRLGLKRVGDLYPLPRAALARRFGLEPGRRLDQALGRIDEPLSPREAPNPHEVRLAFAEPIGAAESIAAALDRLLVALCRHLAAEQLGARRLMLAVYRVDGSLERMAIGTSRANREPAALKRLFLPHLERIDPGFGIETMTLAAPLVQAASDLQLVLSESHAEPAPPRAPAPAQDRSMSRDLPPPAATDPLPPLRAPTPGADRRPPPAERGGIGLLVADLVDQLVNDREPARLYRPAPRESHLPERAVARAPALAEPALPWGEPPPRPVRLLARPEPVAVDPAGPAALPAVFFWRARPHRLRRIEGPERIAPEWWSPEGGSAGGGAGPRDYFRVEDMEGRRFWLYREPADARAPAGRAFDRRASESHADAPARWYLHGLFA
jgi:protein ImuB